MNRSRYVPFERNRYFYGKLLTVRDFMTEQTYNADKRRLVNRLLYGSGVVSGLQVIAVDDKSISIETGVALDSLGREIVIPSPVTMKLSNVDGFMNNDYAKNVYLCLAYDEKAKEPVHAVGGSTSNEEVNEYNRIQESYRLYITDKRPKFSALLFDSFIYDQWIWYEDGNVTIIQQAPRYIEKGKPFDITFKIEKTLQAPPISFEFVPQFECLEVVDGLTDGKIVFHEPTDSGETAFEKTITVNWQREEEEDEKKQDIVVVKLSAQANSAKLVIGDRVVFDLSYLKQKIEVVEGQIEERILHAYYNRPLDQALESPSESAIYIAQINLLQLGASYVIDKVIQQPFNDYVINPTLLYKLLQANGLNQQQVTTIVQQSVEAVANPVNLPFPSIEEEFAKLYPPQIEEAPPSVVSGLIEINIVPEKKKKWYHSKQNVFYSEEIEHTFSTHAPMISIALSDEEQPSDVIVPQMWKKSNALITGDPTLFKNSEYAVEYPSISWSIIQFPAKGTFMVAVKVHKKTERVRLRLKWWAAQAVDLQLKEQEEAQQFGHAQAAAARQ